MKPVMLSVFKGIAFSDGDRHCVFSVGQQRHLKLEHCFKFFARIDSQRWIHVSIGMLTK